MQEYMVSAIVLLAVVTQSLSGFGMGLVAMSLLPEIIDIRFASPLVALLSVFAHTILAIFYRQSLDLRAIKKLIIGLVVAIPLGVFALQRVEQKLILTLLGITIASYTIYSWFELKLPQINSSKWAYFFGFLSGLLSGAYNTGGPPVIVYAHCCRWKPEQFKSNLQSFFLVGSIVLVISHSIERNYTLEVIKLFTYSFPSLILGLLTGIFCSRYINPLIFRKLILLLLFLMSLRLIFY